MPRILKFGTNLGYVKLYCVLENQPSSAYHSLYLIIFLSHKNSSYAFLSSYLSRILQILYTPRGWQSVLCIKELRCL